MIRHFLDGINSHFLSGFLCPFGERVLTPTGRFLYHAVGLPNLQFLFGVRKNLSVFTLFDRFPISFRNNRTGHTSGSTALGINHLLLQQVLSPS
jgi:hypothetical protein